MNTFRHHSLFGFSGILSASEDYGVCDIVDEAEYKEADRKQISRDAINLRGGYDALAEEFIHI